MAAREPIYFDYNATTPLDHRVLAAMRPCLESTFGNASSIHRIGREARVLLDAARERVAGVLRCKPSEFTFTSGGTESNNLAILGCARRLRSRGRHLITSPVEHPAVLRCFEHLRDEEGFELSLLPVDHHGVVDLEELPRILRKDTILVSVMAANNEIGSLQPVAALGSICRERGVLFHTDAVQWFGKMPLVAVEYFCADVVSLCAHKIYGPKGIGGLYVRSGTPLAPVLFGGSHEGDRRPGTENVAGAVGLAKALELFVAEAASEAQRLAALSARLRTGLEIVPGVCGCSDVERCLPNTVSVTVEGAESISLLAALDLEGFCVSGGSACSSGALKPSPVLIAMGLDQRLAQSLVRFSLGMHSKAAEVDALIQIWPALVQRIRSCGASSP